ncbi:MAG: GNAT family N-acetyltransferase [Candidatus Eremiobacteraeota bacterium]|nr:GNAT family N-acetyltransferase [Candidatus Eremiobacteraeota bacterium]
MLTAGQDPHAALEALIEAFESCTLPYPDWTHRAHLSVAFYYLVQRPWPEALERIRAGIQAYNASQGIEQTETGGYHDSLTIFFAQLIAEFLLAAPPSLTLGDLLEELWASCSDKSLPLKFYTRERLMGRGARFGWVEPDRACIRGGWDDHVWLGRGCDQSLLAEAQAEMEAAYAQVELFEGGQALLGLTAWWQGGAVGCAALCPFETGQVELRRLYVRPSARGRGVARKLLTRLEQLAAEAGYHKLVLETGLQQAGALALYRSAGYTQRAAYGAYTHNPQSLCFEKTL